MEVELELSRKGGQTETAPPKPHNLSSRFAGCFLRPSLVSIATHVSIPRSFDKQRNRRTATHHGQPVGRPSRGPELSLDLDRRLRRRYGGTRPRPGACGPGRGRALPGGDGAQRRRDGCRNGTYFYLICPLFSFCPKTNHHFRCGLLLLVSRSLALYMGYQPDHGLFRGLKARRMGWPRVAAVSSPGPRPGKPCSWTHHTLPGPCWYWTSGVASLG